jgi:hypothetical protein
MLRLALAVSAGNEEHSGAIDSSATGNTYTDGGRGGADGGGVVGATAERGAVAVGRGGGFSRVRTGWVSSAAFETLASEDGDGGVDHVHEGSYAEIWVVVESGVREGNLKAERANEVGGDEGHGKSCDVAECV